MGDARRICGLLYTDLPTPEISVPTTLIWGRHDRQTQLAVAQRASARYGWPLHEIEDAADDPAFEQPEAVLRAFSVARSLSR